MAKLILSGKPDLLGLFRRAEKDLGLDARISFCEVDIQDLVPLVWRSTVAFENSNEYRVTELAARLLFVENRRSLHAEHRRLKAELPRAAAGDFIIVLPGADVEEDEDITYDGNDDDILDWFYCNRVKVCFVGAEVPADVRHVLKAEWTSSPIYADSRVAAAIKESPDVTVSVFDAVRLKFSIDCVEAFQRLHFPKRTEVTVRELVPYLDNQHVLKLVCQMLQIRWRFSNAADLRPIAQALGVEGWLVR